MNSMNRICSVIVDGEGRFVPGLNAFFVSSNEVSYCTCTGRCTGFTTYGNTEILEKDLSILRKINTKYNLGKNFIMKTINKNNIKKGKLLIENISLSTIHNKLANA